MLIVDNAYVPNDSAGCATAASFSYRRGANARLLTTPAAPSLGMPWLADLDCSAYRNPGRGYLFAYTGSASGTFVPEGEVLVNLRSPRAFILAARHRGGVASFRVRIPVRAPLCGLELFVQGMCEDTRGAELTNAIDLVLGR